MSMTFTKLFASITESSVWVTDDHTRIVWITMLAMADKYGRVWASIPGLANRARVPVEACEKAIAVFMGPDPYSRTKDREGRRIEEIDGGWRLLNHAKYRKIRDEEARREQNKEAQERFRKKSKPESAEGKLEVSRDKPTGKPIAEAESESEADPFPEGGVGENGEVLNADPDTKASALPSERPPETVPPPAPPWQPTEMQKRFNRFFNRRDTTPWNKKEIAALRALGEIEPEVLATTERYYAAKLPKDGDYRRHDLLTLLNNWNGECDRARRYRPTNCL